jgi:ATP-dependent Clp protease ATP-binding subunit ClpX
MSDLFSQEIYFDNSDDALEYAKGNPGITIIRHHTKDGYKIKSDESNTPAPVKKIKIDSTKTPNGILKHLNKHVISQEEAKSEIALAMYYHYLKVTHGKKNDLKNNGPLMLVGSTGTGKTFIVQKACEYMDMLFIHVDSSSLVPEGIIGYCLGDLAKDIINKANNNLHKAEHCVVFFDEADKLMTSQYGEKVISQLLKLIEGTLIKGTHTSHEPMVELDSSNMQFIFGGAFQWILDEKSKTKPQFGFAKHEQEEMKTSEITLDDLYADGMSKEFLGRIGTIVNLTALTEEDYYNILMKSESSPLKKFINKIEFHGDKVKIPDPTLRSIAKMCTQSQLGVRAINQILKTLFKEALFSAPEAECKIHEINFRKESK